MNNRIRIARGTAVDILNSEEKTVIGQPFYDTTNKYLYIGQNDKRLSDYTKEDTVRAHNSDRIYIEHKYDWSGWDYISYGEVVPNANMGKIDIRIPFEYQGSTTPALNLIKSAVNYVDRQGELHQQDAESTFMQITPGTIYSTSRDFDIYKGELNSNHSLLIGFDSHTYLDGNKFDLYLKTSGDNFRFEKPVIGNFSGKINNKNITDIFEDDGLTVKRANYDLVITNQNEFDNFCNSLDAGTCTAQSVLIKPNSLDSAGYYRKTDGKGLKLPFSLRIIDGIGRVNINFSNFEYNAQSNPAFIYYTNSGVADNEAVCKRISGISFRLFSKSGSKLVGFSNCENIQDCSVEFTSVGVIDSNAVSQIFVNCVRIDNCYIGSFDLQDLSNDQYKNIDIFSSSKNISNIQVNLRIKTYTNLSVLNYCDRINNVLIYESDIESNSNSAGSVAYFDACQFISNVDIDSGAKRASGKSVIGLRGCYHISTTHVMCSESSGSAYGFSNCRYISSSTTTDRITGSSLVAFDGCHNVSSSCLGGPIE